MREREIVSGSLLRPEGEVEKDKKEGEEQNDEDQLLEEVTFDRCFYIYGGPEQLEVFLSSKDIEKFSKYHFCML